MLNKEATFDIPIEVAGEVEVIYEEEGAEEEEEAVVQKPKKAKAKNASGKRKKTTSSANNNVDLVDKVNWSKTTLKANLSLQDFHPFEMVSHLEGKSPLEIWSLIFSTDIISYITEQTELNAGRDRGDHSFYVEDEICRFLGFIVLTGYHSLPSEVDYWSTQADLKVPIVSGAMTKNRYQTIKKYFHVADNQNLEKGNEAAKVQPLYDKLNHTLKRFGVLHHQLSIDESMVP